MHRCGDSVAHACCAPAPQNAHQGGGGLLGCGVRHALQTALSEPAAGSCTVSSCELSKGQSAAKWPGLPQTKH
jgi:hypothetical protein